MGGCAGPELAVLHANRAAAHIRMRQWEAAEADCTAALALDAHSVKAYTRRAAARLAHGGGRLQDAIRDMRAACMLAPEARSAPGHDGLEAKALAGRMLQVADAVLDMVNAGHAVHERALVKVQALLACAPAADWRRSTADDAGAPEEQQWVHRFIATDNATSGASRGVMMFPPEVVADVMGGGRRAPGAVPAGVEQAVEQGRAAMRCVCSY